MILDCCNGAYSSKVGDHKVSWVSCGVCRRLWPLAPEGDGGKDTGRGGTGRVSRDEISDVKDSVSTICLRNGCWWVTGFSGRLPLDRPVSGDEFEFGVAFVECLRSSMAIARRREMCEAKSRRR